MRCVSPTNRLLVELNIRLLGALMFAVGAPAAAFADDEPAVTAKICAAAAKISSFVITSDVKGTTGVTSQMTFVRPKKVKAVVTIGTLSVESYMVDDTIYMHSPLARWQKMSIGQVTTSPTALNIAENLKTAKVNYLPDRQEDGADVGAFEVDLPAASMTSTLPGAGSAPAAGAAPQTLTCTYDKATFLTRTCTNDVMTLTYSKYNDPANVVDLPADAKNATPLILPAPAPNASGPSGTTPAAGNSPAVPPPPAPAASPQR